MGRTSQARALKRSWLSTCVLRHALGSSKGAQYILHSTRTFDTISEATFDCDLTVAFTRVRLCSMNCTEKICALNWLWHVWLACASVCMPFPCVGWQWPGQRCVLPGCFGTSTWMQTCLITPIF